MRFSLKTHIALLLGLFALLVLTATGATLWGVQTQTQDALVINLAGRQRMLVQEMTLLSLEEIQETKPDHAFALNTAIETFDRTLVAFEQGGQTPYLPDQDVYIAPAQSPEIRASLAEVRALWIPFQSAANAILAGDNATDTVRELTPDLLNSADEVVRQYQVEAARKVARLRDIQRMFLGTTLLLLTWGLWLLRRSILLPVQNLQAAVQRIESSDLETPLHIAWPQEFHTLAAGFESMRRTLLQWRQEAGQWTATLETRVSQRTAELDALNKVSLEIAAQLDTKKVLDSIVDNARQLLGADAAALCLVQENGAALCRETLSGPAEAFTGRRVTPLDKVQNAFGGLPCTHCQVPCNIVTPDYHRHHLAVTLQNGKQPLGAFCVASAGEQPFPEDAVVLLTRLANAAVVAMQNARLYTRAEQSAVLEERQRLATELHDGLGQLLASIHLLTDRTLEEWPELDATTFQERIESICKASQQAVRIARQAITSLSQDVISTASLQSRLQEQVAGLQPYAHCPIYFEDALSQPVMLTKEQEEQILHITQEAVWNAIRHAEATEIRMHLRGKADALLLEIADTGRGFSSQQPVANAEGHFGLSIMQARAEFINGTLEIISAPSEGTRVVLYCPLKETHEPISLVAGG